MEYIRLAMEDIKGIEGIPTNITEVSFEGLVLGAVEDDKLCGILVIEYKASVKIIKYIYIDEDYRCQGHGSMLIALSQLYDIEDTLSTVITYDEFMVEDVIIMKSFLENNGFYVGPASNVAYRVPIDALGKSDMLNGLKDYKVSANVVTPITKAVHTELNAELRNNEHIAKYFLSNEENRQKYRFSQLVFDQSYTSYGYILTSYGDDVLYIDDLFGNNKIATLSAIVSLCRALEKNKEIIKEIRFMVTNPEAEGLVEKILLGKDMGIETNRVYNAMKM